MSNLIVDAFGNALEYRPCTLEDIPKHFSCVKRIIEPEIRAEYRNRMKQAVKASTAYCIEGTNIFLYYLKDDEYISEGVSLSGKGKPVELLALLTAITCIEDTDTVFVRFFLHHKSNVEDFRSLLEANSLKGQIGYPKRITIRADKLRKKFNKLGLFNG